MPERRGAELAGSCGSARGGHGGHPVGRWEVKERENQVASEVSGSAGSR